MSSKVWSVVLGGVAVVSLAATIPLSVFAHLLDDGVVALVIGVPCVAVGFLVARRQPRNPLGWLFLVIAGSTGRATTPTAPSPRSPPASRTPWT